LTGAGLDFGTSNSTAALFDGERLTYVRLEGDSPILPTAIHLDRAYSAITGQAAIDQYVEENRGRRVELVAEVIGEASREVGSGELGDENPELTTSKHLLFGPLTDRGLKGRLFHGLKRLLGDPTVERLSVFEQSYRLVALITPILERMRIAILEHSRSIGAGEVPSVHIGRPILFEGRHPDRNRVALARLGEAAGHARLPSPRFYPEPVAATLSWLWQARPSEPGIALTVDFGGGTLDLCLVRHGAGTDDAGRGFEVLGTDGIGLGGNRIDQLIFRELLFPELGKGQRWQRPVEGRRVDTLFPFEEFEAGLLNWQTTHLLNQNRTRWMVVDAVAQGGPAAENFQRLLDLISYNYSYNCFQAIRVAKAELSERTATEIDIPELNLRIPFTRARFDELLRGPLEETRALIEGLLARTGITADEVSMVIRTGGSSQIVAVRALLEEMFPGRVAAHDPFTSVAAGLAIASHRGWQYQVRQDG
jgi:hypothetical chaperone protein